MSIIRNRFFGDSVNVNHRSSLSGNAMLFNYQRWVRLTDGLDTIPFLLPGCSFIFSHVNDTQFATSGGYGGSYMMVQSSFLDWSLVNSTVIEAATATSAIASLGNSNNIWVLTRLTNNTSDFRAGRKSRTFQLSSFRRYVNIFTTSPDFVQWNSFLAINGRDSSANNNYINSNPVVTNNNIGIGRFPQATNPRVDMPYRGWIRSIEVVFRELTHSEIRSIFNFGTAWHARQAGAITIPASQLLSIDFDGPANPSGVPIPWCRPNSLRLTVTPFNNTTPDPTGAGATYVNWYTL